MADIYRPITLKVGNCWSLIKYTEANHWLFFFSGGFEWKRPLAPVFHLHCIS